RAHRAEEIAIQAGDMVDGQADLDTGIQQLGDLRVAGLLQAAQLRVRRRTERRAARGQQLPLGRRGARRVDELDVRTEQPFLLQGRYLARASHVQRDREAQAARAVPVAP